MHWATVCTVRTVGADRHPPSGRESTGSQAGDRHSPAFLSISQARKWGPVSSMTTSRYHSDWAELGLEPEFLPPHWGWQTVHWLAPTSLSGCGEPCTENPEAVLGLSGNGHGD